MLQHDLDPIFQALGDSTRRAMVAQLARGPASVSELARPFPVSLSAIGQHLRLLEDCGLVTSTKVGRVRTVALVPDTLARAERWFFEHRARWERRLDRLADVLNDDDDAAADPAATNVTTREPP